MSSWIPDQEVGQRVEAVLYENNRFLSTGLMLRAETTEWVQVPIGRMAGEALPGT